MSFILVKKGTNGVKVGPPDAEPHDPGNASYLVISDFQNMGVLRPVKADWPVAVVFFIAALDGKWVVDRGLVVRTQNVFDVLLADLLFCPADEWQVRVFRVLVDAWVQDLLPIPDTGSVVVAILFSEGAEDMAEVPAFQVRVELVFDNKVLDPCTPHEVITSKVNFLDGDPVGGDGISIVGDSLSDPVVADHDFHVPNFILVRKKD